MFSFPTFPTEPPAVTLPPLPTFLTEPSVSAKALASLLDAIQPPAFTLPPMPSLASILETMPPPTFTLPPLPTFWDERERATISRLVMPLEFRQPSTSVHRSFMLETYGEIFDFENEVRRFIDGQMGVMVMDC